MAITSRSWKEKNTGVSSAERYFSLVLPLFSQTSDIVSVNLFPAFLLMKFNALPPTLSSLCIHRSLSCVSAALSAYRAIGITSTVIWTWEDWCFLTNTGRSPIKSHSGLAEAAANTALQSEDIICEDAACVWVGKVTKSIWNKHTRPLMYLSAAVFQWTRDDCQGMDVFIQRRNL